MSTAKRGPQSGRTLTVPDAQHGWRLAVRAQRFTPTADGCWLWTGSTTSNGYPQQKAGPRVHLGHRVSWVAHSGLEVPDGTTIGHLCHDTAARAGLCDGGPDCPHRRCVNPDHLEPQSIAANTAATVNSEQNRRRAQERCSRGHRLVGANLRKAQTLRGWRCCRSCHLAQRKADHRGLPAGADREAYVRVEADRRYRELARTDAELAGDLGDRLQAAEEPVEDLLQLLDRLEDGAA